MKNAIRVIVAYSQEFAAILLDNGLADEMVVVTLPEIIGGAEKTLLDAVKDGAVLQYVGR